MLLSLGLIKVVDNYYSKTTKDYIYNESKILVYNTLNEVITDCISPYLEEELVFVKYQDNTVSDVVLNSKTNNQILKEVHNKLTHIFQNNINLYFQTLEIPIGSLISKNLFFGSGFNLNIPIKPIGSYEVDLKTKTKTQGINTSLLEVVLTITFSIQAIVPLNIQTNKITNEFLLSSVLIQGKVPNYYYASNNTESFPYIPN